MEAIEQGPEHREPAPRIEQYGPDRVEIHGSRVVIRSPVDMERWEVLEYRKPLIGFEGRTWTLVAKRPGIGETIRYDLVLWDPAPLDLPGHRLEYGPHAVAERDRARRQGQRDALATIALIALSPLAGFLFSRTKQRLEDRLGVTSAQMTGRSLFVEYLAILNGGVLVVIGMISGAALPIVPIMGALMFVLPDAIIRWSRLLEGDRALPGFWEWLWLGRGR